MSGISGVRVRPADRAGRRPSHELSDKITLDSQILAEQFYYFTVVIMWLIHVGFMSYEAGAGRRKNVMATAMKNILTIAVVTPTFFYFGWWIYGCFGHGNHPDQPRRLPRHAPAQLLPGKTPSEGAMANFCSDDVSVVGEPRPEPDRSHLRRLLGGIPPVLVDDGFDPVGRADRARAALCLSRCSPCILGSVIWILDASWGWSWYGFLPTRWGFHDSIAGLVVHGVAGAFTLGVLFNLGPRIGKYTKDGLARTLQAAQPAPDAHGPDADLHRLLRVLRSLPRHPVDRRFRAGATST